LACHFAELKRSAYQQLDNFLRQPENLLFRYWEYLGSDFSADMHLLAEFEITLQWWTLCMLCQQAYCSIKEDQWWEQMQKEFELT